MAQQPLYELIAANFELADLKLLAKKLQVDYDDLAGSTKKLRVLSLQEYLSNRGRLNELIAALHLDRPHLDLRSYLWMIVAELFNGTSAMKALIERFGQNARDFGGPEKFAWGSPPWIEEKAQALQNHLETSDQIDNLLGILLEKRPAVDLRFYDQPQPQPDLAPPPPLDPKPHQRKSTSSRMREVTLENFDLHIGKAINGQYPISVTSSPAGQTPDPIWQAFPLAEPEFTRLFDYVANLLADPGEGKNFGRRLRDLLFPGQVWDLFFASWTKVRDYGGLRIRLRIDPPELSRLPWEYCYDETLRFLALKRKTPLVRFIAQPFSAGNIMAPRPARVLLAMAAPEGLAPLSMDEEEARVREALAELGGLVELTVLRHATTAKLHKAVAEGVHILHFVGHGIQDGPGLGGLALEDETGGLHKVDAEQLMPLLGDSGLNVVVLNACQTAAHDEADAFLGVAQALVQAEIPAVLAMQFDVPDRAGVLFARTLYTFLAAGKPLDAAVTEMRIGAFAERTDKLYWAIPALFMRSEDGLIWQAPATGGVEAGQMDQAAQQTQTIIVQNTINIDTLQGDLVEGTKVVEGDEIRGDKAGGDINKGDINIQGGIHGGRMAIGHGARYIEQHTELTVHFETIYRQIEERAADPDIDKEEIREQVKEIEEEAAKGEKANPKRIGRWLRFLGEMAPDIAEVTIATLANPIVGVAVAVRKVAQKASE